MYHFHLTPNTLRHLKVTMTTHHLHTLNPTLAHSVQHPHKNTVACKKVLYPSKRCFVSSAHSPVIQHLPPWLEQTLRDTLDHFQATVATDVSQQPPPPHTHIHHHTPSLPSNNQLICTTGLLLKHVLSRLTC